MSTIVGADFGFKQFKGVCLEKGVEFKFDNIIGFPSELEITPTVSELNMELEMLLSNLSLKVDEVKYFIGALAKNHATNHRYTFLANKIETVDEKVKFLTALGVFAHRKINSVDLLVTGVPVEEYHMVKEKINQQMSGKFTYTFRDMETETTVSRVEVIPQGAGDYYDYVLDEDGKIIEERIKPKTLIVNIGYRTTEVVVMNYGKFSRSESTTLYTATNTFHKELIRLIVKKYGVKKNLTQIDEIYRTGKMFHHGKEIDITSLRTQAVQHHIGSIIGEIPVWVEPAEVHELVLSGGGSTGLDDYFKEGLNLPIISIDNREFGNANGFNKYGKLMMANVTVQK